MSVITHLRSLRLTDEDPTHLVDFYESIWGLERVATSCETVYLRGRGTEHHVLELAKGAPRTLDQISLGATDRSGVDQLAERLREHDVSIESGPGERQDPGGGYAVIFRDPEGRRIEVSADVKEHAEPAATDIGPDRLSHIVLNAPELAASKDFYVDVLGFQVSDWYEQDLMIFLRCNTIHHCLVLAPNTWPTINHVAFEVNDVDEVMSSLGRLRKAGLDTIWGPGRHGPGGNVFCYFTDPVGNVIEYTAELLEVGQDWIPKEWERSPDNADVWGTSGGITPAVIQAMANPPPGGSVDAS